MCQDSPSGSASARTSGSDHPNNHSASAGTRGIDNRNAGTLNGGGGGGGDGGAGSNVEWEARIISDWQASLGVLQKIWQDSGGFDAILGFSNGAAARYCVLIRRGGEGGVCLRLLRV